MSVSLPSPFVGTVTELRHAQHAPANTAFPHSGLQPQFLEHINAQGILKNKGHINSILMVGVGAVA